MAEEFTVLAQRIDEPLLVAMYLRMLRFDGSAELLDFSFGGNGPHAATVRVARLALPCTDGSTLWVIGSVKSTPDRERNETSTPHQHHFIGLGSSSHKAMAELVAATFHFDRFVEPLAMDHTFPLGNRSALRDLGFVRGFVLAPVLKSAQKVQRCGSAKVALWQVAPITAEDFALKSSVGTEALLEQWQRTHHDTTQADLQLGV